MPTICRGEEASNLENHTEASVESTLKSAARRSVSDVTLAPPYRRLQKGQDVMLNFQTQHLRSTKFDTTVALPFLPHQGFWFEAQSSPHSSEPHFRSISDVHQTLQWIIDLPGMTTQMYHLSTHLILCTEDPINSQHALPRPFMRYTASDTRNHRRQLSTREQGKLLHRGCGYQQQRRSQAGYLF